MGLRAFRPERPIDFEGHIERDHLVSSVWQHDNARLIKRREVSGSPFSPKDVFRLHTTAKSPKVVKSQAVIHREAPGVILGLPVDLVERQRLAGVDVPIAVEGLLGVMGRTRFVRQFVSLSKHEVESVIDQHLYPDSVISKAAHNTLHGQPDLAARSRALDLIATEAIAFAASHGREIAL